ncbi:hypothetical protein ASF93_08075 [Microbacterium sp. Leaf347]|nr:hypothetical protein ASF93_08075 [Microbacterium sp. Leaf347]OJU76990.1 MAG: hypothetical protein BGO15_05660 [Microbacterium sp. 71-23]
MGYGAVFNSQSRDLGGWVEEIDPAAFGPVGPLDLAVHTRVIARAEHDSRLLLGTTDAGTLRVAVDDIGLPYSVDLPNTSAGRDAAELASRGDYSHSSFAFRILPDGVEWRENADGILVRRILRAVLIDVAPVADPAYWAATAELQRSVDLDAVRAALHPQPPAPGDWENAATERSAARLSRKEHTALATRSRGRGKNGGRK